MLSTCVKLFIPCAAMWFDFWLKIAAPRNEIDECKFRYCDLSSLTTEIQSCKPHNMYAVMPLLLLCVLVYWPILPLKNLHTKKFQLRLVLFSISKHLWKWSELNGNSLKFGFWLKIKTMKIKKNIKAFQHFTFSSSLLYTHFFCRIFISFFFFFEEKNTRRIEIVCTDCEREAVWKSYDSLVMKSELFLCLRNRLSAK